MKLINLIVPAALIFSPIAFSATDGTLGADSTGSTDVSISIGDLLQVTVEGDVTLGSATAGSDSVQSTGLCIYRNSDADVDVTLTTQEGTGTQFAMIGSGTETLDYSVTLAGNAAASGTPLTISDENNTASDCGGAYPHTLEVTVAAADIDAATADSYTDTITILVEPN